jgi:hypothetical protein
LLQVAPGRMCFVPQKQTKREVWRASPFVLKKNTFSTRRRMKNPINVLLGA